MNLPGDLLDLGRTVLADQYNLPYFLTLLAYIIHEMLGLRLVLLAAHGGYFALAVSGGHEAGIFWNALFIGINGYHVIRILHARRKIRFPPDLERVYAGVFADLSRNDFKRFWDLGAAVRHEDRETVLREGQRPGALLLVISGGLLVEKNGGELNRLGPHRFAAEMGYLTGENASASLLALGSTELKRWSYEDLEAFSKRLPDVWHALQGILGREMARKIAEQNPAARR